VRGGFPESFLADDESRSLIWRQDFIRTYLERDIPQLGPRIPATTLHRFWTMLAHVQGGLFNAAQLARGLGVDGKTVARYLDLLADLMLLRRLQPF
jgi:predicted AAA+ superfamily ATPase